jgi:tetratricopeptide (TPR) repeat protein
VYAGPNNNENLENFMVRAIKICFVSLICASSVVSSSIVNAGSDKTWKPVEKGSINSSADRPSLAASLALRADSTKPATTQPPATGGQPTVNDYLMNALTKQMDGDYQGALADYQAALDLAPNDPAIYVQRGEMKFEYLKDTAGALADYDRAIQLDAKSTSAYLGRFNVKIQANDLTGAMTDINKLLDLEPNKPEYYYIRGIMYHIRLKNGQLALADYDRAIQLAEKATATEGTKPSTFDLFTVLVSRLSLKMDLLEDGVGALADANRLVQMKPNNSFAYWIRALVKKQGLGDGIGALTDCNQSLKLDSTNSNAYELRAILRFNFRTDIQGAKADFARALKIDPQKKRIYYNRADMFHALGDRQSALKDYRQVLALKSTESGDNGDDQIVLIAAGVIAFEEKNIPLAIEKFNLAIQKSPDTGDAYKHRGLAYQAQVKKDLARQDWAKAAQLYEKFGDRYHYQLVNKWSKKLG